jgi:hypothetical protein
MNKYNQRNALYGTGIRATYLNYALSSHLEEKNRHRERREKLSKLEKLKEMD